jgi:hypothetical protein
LRDHEDVKMLEECFTKATINSKIITGKARGGETKGLSMLAKLTILGNIKKDTDPLKKDGS